MNILINAKKYTVSKKPQITISIENQSKHLLVRFTDNGIGIAPSEFRKIFSKFYQSRNCDGAPVGGTGIGLYLVQQIARLHNGKVVADSQGADKGSVFTLILPTKAPEITRKEGTPR